MSAEIITLRPHRAHDEALHVRERLLVKASQAI
jgi:hypothetical protein